MTDDDKKLIERLVERHNGALRRLAEIERAEREPLKEFDRAVLVRDVGDYPAGTVGAICDHRPGDLHCIFEPDDKTVGDFPVKTVMLADLAAVPGK